MPNKQVLTEYRFRPELIAAMRAAFRKACEAPPEYGMDPRFKKSEQFCSDAATFGPMVCCRPKSKCNSLKRPSRSSD